MNTVRDSVLAMIMAGGMGHKLEVLTSNVRAQAAVPFGGKYRLIDFALSNFFNSDIKKINVLIQHKSLSLVQHIEENWSYRFGSRDEFIRVLGPMPPHWQKGTADSVFQNRSRIRVENPAMVAVFAGDHVYRMDVRQMARFHQEKGAHLTICATRYPIKKSTGRFGIMERAADGSLKHFEEKSARPIPIPGDEKHMWVSMGNYIFDRDVLLDALEKDSRLSAEESRHDFGNDVIPMLMKTEGIRIFIYEFSGISGTPGKEPPYWRDIGSVESYYDASMDLIAEKPLFEIYRKEWPLYSINTDHLPPPRFYGNSDGSLQHVGHSIVSDGCIIRGGHVEKSILFPCSEVQQDSVLKESIILDGVRIGKNCIIEKAIIDKSVVVPDNTIIRGGRVETAEAPRSARARTAEDPERELFRSLIERSHATASGVLVVPRHYDKELHLEA